MARYAQVMGECAGEGGCRQLLPRSAVAMREHGGEHAPGDALVTVAMIARMANGIT
jgi:hypothetical protein